MKKKSYVLTQLNQTEGGIFSKSLKPSKCSWKNWISDGVRNLFRESFWKLQINWKSELVDDNLTNIFLFFIWKYRRESIENVLSERIFSLVLKVNSQIKRGSILQEEGESDDWSGSETMLNSSATFAQRKKLNSSLGRLTSYQSLEHSQRINNKMRNTAREPLRNSGEPVVIQAKLENMSNWRRNNLLITLKESQV